MREKSHSRSHSVIHSLSHIHDKYHFWSDRTEGKNCLSRSRMVLHYVSSLIRDRVSQFFTLAFSSLVCYLEFGYLDRTVVGRSSDQVLGTFLKVSLCLRRKLNMIFRRSASLLSVSLVSISYLENKAFIISQISISLVQIAALVLGCEELSS